jgi:hypothetical protein
MAPFWRCDNAEPVSGCCWALIRRAQVIAYPCSGPTRVPGYVEALRDLRPTLTSTFSPPNLRTATTGTVTPARNPTTPGIG